MADEKKTDSDPIAKIAEEVKSTTTDAVKNIKPDIEQVADVQGANSKKSNVVYAGRSDNEYQIRPCALSDIPQLVAHVKNIEEKINAADDPGNILTAEDAFVLKEMAAVICMGLTAKHPDMTTEQVMQEFTLGDFPDIYKMTLDLNDFLSGMRRMYQTR